MSNKQPVPLTFVVSSGRCGSTMLSRALHNHPDVLSASEFMHTMRAAMGGPLFAQPEVSGQALWDGLCSSDPEVEEALLARSAGLTTPATLPAEFAYPDTGRFRPETGIPWICYFVLPVLSEDPDALFDQLAGEVPGWPARAPADQYRAILEYLAGLLGRRVAVERSGGSALMMPGLLANYPDAGFVHLYRNGPDCALSMSKFLGYRKMILGIMATAAARLPEGTPWHEVEEAAPEFKGMLTAPRDWDRIVSYPIPVSYFGNLWTWYITEAVNGLGKVPPERRLCLRYEKLVEDPRTELTRLAEFIDVPASSPWLDRVCGTVTGGRIGTAATELGPNAVDDLRAACEPGEKMLAAMEAGDSSR